MEQHSIINEYLENHRKINMMNGLTEDVNSEKCSEFLAKKTLEYLMPVLNMFKTTLIPFDDQDIPTHVNINSVALTNARLKDHLEDNESQLAYKNAISIQNDILEKALILGASNRVDVYSYEPISSGDGDLGDFLQRAISDNTLKLNPGKPWIIVPSDKYFRLQTHPNFSHYTEREFKKSPITTDFVYQIGYFNDIEVYVNPNKFNGVLFGSDNSEMFGGIVLQLYNIAENVYAETDRVDSELYAGTRYRLMLDSHNAKKSYMYLEF